MEVFVGTSGWSYSHWTGLFYPETLERKKWLEFYCKRFTTAEVNMTFYRFPFPAILKNWALRTPENFVFTFKANRQITHVKRFVKTETLVRRFYSLLKLIGNKLGCLLWQLPPGMHYSEKNLKTLESFLSFLNEEKMRRNVIEFRHPSWWNDTTYRMLKRKKATFCIVSAPRLPDDFIVTCKVGYIRFHGRERWYASEYSLGELRVWAKRIKAASKTCEEFYCYFNNDYNAYAPKNASQLKRLLKG